MREDDKRGEKGPERKEKCLISALRFRRNRSSESLKHGGTSLRDNNTNGNQRRLRSKAILGVWIFCAP